MKAWQWLGEGWYVGVELVPGQAVWNARRVRLDGCSVVDLSAGPVRARVVVRRVRRG